MSCRARCLRAAAGLALLGAMTTTGCASLILGRTQVIEVWTTPDGATAALAGVEFVAPAEVRIRRSQVKGWVVLRAEAEGYRPACRLIAGRRTVGLMILDAMPLAVPLIADGILIGFDSMRSYPSAVHIKLRRLEPGEQVEPLPSDEEILDAWRMGKINLCLPNPNRGMPPRK